MWGSVWLRWRGWEWGRERTWSPSKKWRFVLLNIPSSWWPASITFPKSTVGSSFTVGIRCVPFRIVAVHVPSHGFFYTCIGVRAVIREM